MMMMMMGQKLSKTKAISKGHAASENDQVHF